MINHLLDYNDYLIETLRYSTGMNQKRVIEVQNKILESITSLFRIKESDCAFIGSAGKRKKEDLSHNINMAIDSKILLSKNNLDEKELSDFVIKEIKRLGYSAISENDKITVSWKHKKESIDLILQLTENLEWVKFARYSPSQMLKESEYHGKYREACFSALSRVLEKKIVSYYDTNESVKEYETFRFDADEGLCIYRKSFEGKNGKLKVPILLESSKRIFCDDPKQFVEMAFGEKYTLDDVKTFEDCLSIIESKDFKFRKRKKEVYSKLKQELVNRQLHIPEKLN